MQVILYNCISDARTINKKLLNATTFNGELRESCNIINPTITLNASNISSFNFAYIPDWSRYYFIEDIISYSKNLSQVILKCDVLMTYKDDIMGFSVVVEKQTGKENSDEYIDDGSLISANKQFSEVINFNNGFNNDGTFILATMG